MKFLGNYIVIIVSLLVLLTVLFILDFKRNLILEFKRLDFYNPHFKNGVAQLDLDVVLDVTNDTFFSYNIQEISVFVYDNLSGNVIGKGDLQDYRLNKGENILELRIKDVSILDNIQRLQNGKMQLKTIVFIKFFGITNKIEKVIEI